MLNHMKIDNNWYD